MKTCVKPTSIDAYYQVPINAQQKELLFAMKCSPNRFCRTDVASLIQWERSTVSARINEMVKLGIVKVDGTMKSSISGKTVEALRLVRKETLFEE